MSMTDEQKNDRINAAIQAAKDAIKRNDEETERRRKELVFIGGDKANTMKTLSESELQETLSTIDNNIEILRMQTPRTVEPKEPSLKMSFDELYDEIMAGANIISGKDYQNIMKAIAQIASDMVIRTLGPYGATTIIDDGSGFTYPSKDGWTALSNLRFSDALYNTLYGMLKQISFNSANTVGDGTSTAMVGANAFLQRVGDLSGTVGRQADLIAAVKEAATLIEEGLLHSPRVQHIEDDGVYQSVYDIAYIATNGNDLYAKMIQEIYQKTGNPNIHVSIGTKSETCYQIEQGYKFESQVIDFSAYINESSGICRKSGKTECYIFDHNLNFGDHQFIIKGLLEMAELQQKDIIIMAPYFDDIVAASVDALIRKYVNARQIPRIMLMQIPMGAKVHTETLQDLCLLTNATIFNASRVKVFNAIVYNQTHVGEEVSNELTEVDGYAFQSTNEIYEACAGTIRTLVVEAKKSYLQDFETVVNQPTYEALLREVTEAYEMAKVQANKTLNSHLNKEYMDAHMRYVKLMGKTGNIIVGGGSDLEKRCDKDSIDDAVLACRSAYESGFIRGLNLETLTVIHSFIREDGNPGSVSKDVLHALNMLYGTFYDVTMAVIHNKYASCNDEVVRSIPEESFGTVRLSNATLIPYCIENDLGYNLRTDRLEAKGKYTVITSLSTDLEILRAIVNVLTVVMTSDQFLSINKFYDRKASHAQERKARVDDKRAMTEVATKTFFSTIIQNPQYQELLSDLFSEIGFRFGASMMGDEDDVGCASEGEEMDE